MEKEECNQIHKELCQRANLNNRKSVQNQIALMFVNDHYWKQRSPEGVSVKTFNSFMEYVQHKTPWGLHWSEKILEGFLLPESVELWREIIGQIPASNPHGGDRFSEKSNLRPKVENYGESRTYQIATLKRDAPDIAEKVIKGEISAAKGMVMAGKRTPTVRCKVSVQGFYDAIHRKLDPHEIDLLKAML
jgi:hypothetical protein